MHHPPFWPHAVTFLRRRVRTALAFSLDRFISSWALSSERRLRRGPHTGLAAMTQPGLHPDTMLDDVFSDYGLKKHCACESKGSNSYCVPESRILVLDSRNITNSSITLKLRIKATLLPNQTSLFFFFLYKHSKCNMR